MNRPQDGIAEGHKEILDLCKLSSWRSIMDRKSKKPGFKSLFRRNPSNGKPYIVIEEYRRYIEGYNENP